MDIPHISVEVIINMGFMADWDVEIPQYEVKLWKNILDYIKWHIHLFKTELTDKTALDFLEMNTLCIFYYVRIL